MHDNDVCVCARMQNLFVKEMPVLDAVNLTTTEVQAYEEQHPCYEPDGRDIHRALKIPLVGIMMLISDRLQAFHVHIAAS